MFWSLRAHCATLCCTAHTGWRASSHVVCCLQASALASGIWVPATLATLRRACSTSSRAPGRSRAWHPGRRTRLLTRSGGRLPRAWTICADRVSTSALVTSAHVACRAGHHFMMGCASVLRMPWHASITAQGEGKGVVQSNLYLGVVLLSNSCLRCLHRTAPRCMIQPALHAECNLASNGSTHCSVKAQNV